MDDVPLYILKEEKLKQHNHFSSPVATMDMTTHNPPFYNSLSNQQPETLTVNDNEWERNEIKEPRSHF